MKQIIKVLMSIAILAVLVIGFYYITKTISAVTGKSILGWLIKEDIEEEKLNDFAKCLSEKGVVLYVRNGCPHCKAQEEDFRSGLQYLTITECSQNVEKCSELIGVPAWEIPGKEDFIYGRQSLEELSELTGCELQ